jgi:hypothetical protein
VLKAVFRAANIMLISCVTTLAEVNLSELGQLSMAIKAPMVAAIVFFTIELVNLIAMFTVECQRANTGYDAALFL